jgi:hypothetical protein
MTNESQRKLPHCDTLKEHTCTREQSSQLSQEDLKKRVSQDVKGWSKIPPNETRATTVIMLSGEATAL